MRDARPRSRRGREPPAVPRRPGRRHRRGARRSHDRRRALSRRARRLARVRALAARRQGPHPLVPGRRRAVPRWSSASTSRRCGATTGSSCACPTWTSRRPPDLFVPSPEEVESLVLQQLGAQRAVRGEVPRGRGPRAAAAAPSGRPARAALAAAQARGGSAGRRLALRVLPRGARDVPGVPARRVRHARAGGHPAARRAARHPRGRRGHGAAVAVCRLAALQLRRDVPLRRRRAAGRTARAGADGGSRAAARPARRCRAARAARPRRPRGARAAAAVARRGPSRAQRRRHPRPAAAPRRPVAGRARRARGLARRAGGDRRARRHAPHHRRARGRRAALRGRRGRGALSRRAGRAAAAGIARRAAAARAGRGGRSRPALRAHARAVYRRHLRAAFRRERLAVVQEVLARLATAGRVLQGEFRPGGFEREWCGVDVLRTLAPAVAGAAAQGDRAGRARGARPPRGRVGTAWAASVAGSMPLLDCVEQLQGAPLVASALERDVLPARIEELRRRRPRSAHRGRRGDVGRPRAAWRARRAPDAVPDRPSAAAVAPGARGGGRNRDSNAACSTTSRPRAPRSSRRCTRPSAEDIPDDLVDALWALVWKGLVTNDSLHALRAYVEPPARSRRREAPVFRSRRVTPPPAQGRWSLLSDRLGSRPSPTEWATAVARQLLSRHGVLTREAMNVEAVPGGYGAVYGVLRAMEDAGRVRRGMFVAGLGAAQFTLGPALDLLRAGREPGETPQVVTLASTDPANPYGGVLPWPAPEGAGRPTRSAGTLVDPRRRPAGRVDRPRRPPGAGVAARGRATTAAHRARHRRASSTDWPPSRLGRACSSRKSTACPWAITRWRRISTRSGSPEARWGWPGPERRN